MKYLLTAAALVLVSTSAVAAPVAPGNMAAYCRGEASSQFGTKPMYIKTDKRVRAKNGSYTSRAPLTSAPRARSPFSATTTRRATFCT